MNVKKWLGLVSAASPYALPAGALVQQTNVQVRKPGQLVPRAGMRMVVSSRSGPVLGLHRFTAGAGRPDSLIAHRRNDVDGVDYTLEVASESTGGSSGGASEVAQIFSTVTAPANRPSFCQDRHGTTYCFFGSGIRPQMYRPGTGSTVNCGLDAPAAAPIVTPQGDGFFIERVDVISSGSSYYAPPVLTVTGGNPDRQARLRAVIQGGAMVAVDVIDGGANYRTMPTITISNEQVGSGFLGRGNIASSAPTIGFRDTDAPQSTTNAYIATYTHAYSTTVKPVTIAYRNWNDAGGVTREVAASFDATTTPPTYTALIPVTATSSTWTTTASLTATLQTATVASATNIGIGTELQFPAQYFDANPVVTAIAGTTLTLDKPAKDTGAGVAVTIVQPGNAFAQVKFNTLSSGWTLGNATPTPVANVWTTATGVTSGSATFTAASVSGITAGATLVFPAGYFASNPTVQSVNTSTRVVTVNQNATASSATALNVGVVVASDTFTTTGIGIGGNFKFQSIRQNWYTADDYFQNTDNLSGSSPISYAYNQDKFWGLMPSTDGYWFGYNQVYAYTTTHLFGNFFFPDYFQIGVRCLTGREDQSGVEANWTVLPAFIGYDSLGEPYAEVYLEPMKKPISGAAYSTTVETRYPLVRINLAYCPASWTLDDNAPSGIDRRYHYFNPQMGQWRRLNQTDTDPAGPAAAGGTLGASGTTYPRATGGVVDTAKRWWGYGQAASAQYQPIVDCRKAPDATSESSGNRGVAAGSIQIIDAGAQMEKGTKFRIRLEQYNAYDYKVVAASSFDTWEYDSNAVPSPFAVAVSAMNRNGAFGTTFTDFVFEASELDTAGTAAALLLPGAVNGTPKVVVSGTKWSLNQDGGFYLRQQNPSSPGTFSDSNSYQFRAKELIAAQPSQRIGDVTVLSGGVNYFREPTILVRGGGGYGLRTSAVIANGVITSVVVLEGGDGFTSSPTLYTSVEPAKVMPVLRGTMQGNYRCAYRFADYSQTVVTNVVTLATTAGSRTATLTAPAASGTAIGLVNPDMRITGATAIEFMTRIVAVAPLSATARTVILSHPAKETRLASSCVIRDMERPVSYSNFSPIVDVDAADSGLNRASRMAWSLSGAVAPARADHVEFFRTSADQSLLFYRLEQYATVSNSAITVVGSDTLSDEELFDLERPNYAALPVVLPNGSLNAYRFGVPRSDMAVTAAWQDRMWYGVSTSGADANTVFFSELDEFESCPDINEIPIQNNLRSTDYLTAIVPFGSILLAMQTAHGYAISYNTDPGIDATVQLVAHRGCTCQQTWDVFDDLLYVADERGVYRMSRGGDVENLSDAVRDFFDEEKINWKFRSSFFLKVDNTAGILRFFYTPAGIDSDIPIAALCLHIANNVWWTEQWPNAISCGTDYRGSSGRERVVYGAIDGNIYDFSGTRDYAYRDIQTVSVTAGGSGYVAPPTVTVTDANGRGARFKALLTNGVVTEILILERGSGYGAFSGNTFLSTVNLSLTASPSGQNATATASARQPFQDMNDSDSAPPRTSVPWAVRTGPMALATDASVRGGDRQIDRSICVTYQPTAASKTLVLREYYNNCDDPRPNVMRRDRGTGWVHETSGARATLDMAGARSPLGPATGVAKATFAGRSLDDLGAGDKHLAVELSCDAADVNASEPPEAVVLGLEVRGVLDGD